MYGGVAEKIPDVLGLKCFVVMVEELPVASVLLFYRQKTGGQMPRIFNAYHANLST
jgi:hypothetical protein